MSKSSEGVTLTILADFKFAHRNVDVREYKKGETVETDDAELVEIATENKWATVDKAKGKADKANKAKADAPENKDAAPQAENKATES